MGTMKVVAALVVVACFCGAVGASNIVCGKGTTTKTVTIEEGKAYTFKTQKGKRYKGNTNCAVEYKMGDTCGKMSFVCTKFNTNNKDMKRCKKGDTVTVTASGKAKAYCKTKKPKVTSTGDMSVVFTSDAKKSGTGAVCKVKCTEAAGGTGPPPAEGPYVPGQPGGPWTEEDVEITRERIEEMLNQDNYKGFHIEYPQCSDSRVGLFVCDGSMFQFVKRDPTKGLMGNDNLSALRRPKTSRVIQLGFHDCLKYKDGVTEGAVDGCDGCLNWKGMDFEFKETWFAGNPDNESLVNHFTRSYPISHETGNNGLAGTVKALELIYTNTSWPSSARSVNVSLKESGKSRADLWAFAATVALEIEIVRANFACDIDLERQQTGILEGRDKCDIKLHRPIKFQSGRQDCIPEEGLEAPYMTNKAENHDNPWGHGDKVIANFNRDFGMSAEETIALMAAHGVQSRVHNKFLATKYAWVGTPYLSNVFFKQMAGKPMYGIDADVDGIERLNLVLSGDKEGKPVDNYGYKLTCTAMWNLTNPNGDDGPCYFKRQSNLKQNSVHRPSTMYAALENFGPQLAIDGFVSDYGWHYFATQGQDNPWIEFKLATTKIISSITITLTTHGGSVFKNVEIRAGMEMVGEADVDSIVNINTVCDIFEGPGVKNTAYTIECTEPIEAKYLTIQIKNVDTYLQINELQINDESPLESFAKEKADDEYLRPMCFDTKRRIGNPNLDGEILRIPKHNVDENGDTISGWWTIDPPDDCCANATYVDIPDNNHYKIQQGGCKQVLNKNGDSHNFLLNYEMSLYLNFSINENNRAHGCRGLEPLTLEKHNGFNMVAEENVGCGKNMKNLFSSGGDSYSRIIEKFADDHDDWALQFLEDWDKMLRNGYTAGKLADAPQSSWLGYNSWTKVPADTNDFEEYIVNNTPAKISNNAAEDPTIMSSDKDTYRKECEYKTGMTSWNKNFARCPKGMFDDL